MFRLLVNIGGVFDVYVSRRASEPLRTAILPSLSTIGRVDSFFVERLRFGERTDFGRNRYLLLLTADTMTRAERGQLIGLLERMVGPDLDRLMNAINRDEVSEETQRIYSACAVLDGQEEFLSSRLKVQNDIPSTAAVSQRTSGETDRDQGGQPRAVRLQTHLKTEGQTEEQTEGLTVDKTVNAEIENDGAPLRRRPLSTGVIVAINLLLTGIVFGSMAWYLERYTQRLTGAGAVDKLAEKVEDVSITVAGVQDLVRQMNQTVSELRALSVKNGSDTQMRLAKIERKVATQAETADKVVKKIKIVEGAVEDSNRHLGLLDAWLRKDSRRKGDPPIEGNEVIKDSEQISDWKPTKDQVKEVQEVLKSWRYYVGNIDGHIGPGTTGGIKKWQEENGKPNTGILDIHTFEAIVEDKGKRSE